MTRRIIALLLTGPALLAGFTHAQSTRFTYQGRLTDGGQPAQGAYELRLALYSAENGGSPVAGPLTNAEVTVTNGLFTTFLNFGAEPFNGTDYWLEIAVRTNGSLADFSELTPRQPLTQAPYALFARNSGGVVNPSFLGTTNNTALQFLVNNSPALRLEPTETTPNFVAGFAGNIILNEAAGVTINGGGQIDGTNRATASFATIGGGFGNTAGFNSTIGGGANNESTGGSATVGGGYGNHANGPGTVIAGGVGNTASDEQSTVGGGYGNSATGYNSAVAGGFGNSATNNWTFVGGGRVNVAGGDSSFVGGGSQNLATGLSAVVGGGIFNQALGNNSVVPGGNGNLAQGHNSFAAGKQATASFDGCFVWSDTTPGGIGSFGANTFVARASGGVRFYSGTDQSTGVILDPGSGSWSSLSDRRSKENFRAVDDQEVLERLGSIPMQTWNYKSQDASIRHIGPTAQDFRAAFGLGESEERISTVDADGIALAAIQGLSKKLETQLKARDAELRELRGAVVELKALVRKLEGKEAR